VLKSQQRCCSGSEFHSLAAMTGKARSPSVECHVAGTTKAAVDAERSLCLGRRSDTLVNSLESNPDQDHGDSDMSKHIFVFYDGFKNTCLYSMRTELSVCDVLTQVCV